jgi:hypothetical protein
VLAGVRVFGLYQTTAKGRKKILEMIEQHFMVDALGVWLLFNSPPAPAFDHHLNATLKNGADLGMRLGSNQLRVEGHSGAP